MMTAFNLTAQHRMAYKIFDAEGKEITYEKMLKQLLKNDVVFFGELHNNPIAHWLELTVTQDIFEQKKEQLQLGAEMFEADNQLIINEFFQNNISEKSFEDECRLWNNYKTDYKPLLNFAKENQLAFIATNVPRRYASMVHKQGIESLNGLTDEAKSYIAPLPIEIDLTVNCYKNMADMMGAHGEGNSDIVKAQAVKDATMAHFIATNYQKGNVLLHFNGSYHSDYHEGIIWYLKKLKPRLDIITITSVEQNSVDTLSDEYKNKADFIICIPENMTKTY